MGFSFSGMMRGLGAGLVNSGTLLADKAKRDWEEQQLMLKLEREEHMKRLEMQANKEQADRSYNLQKLGIEGQTAYQQKSLENQGLQLTIARENQAGDQKFRELSLQAQREAANKKSDAMTMFEKQQESMRNVYKAAFKGDPKAEEKAQFMIDFQNSGLAKNEKGEKLPDEVAKIIADQTFASVEKMSDKDKTAVADELEIPRTAPAKQRDLMIANAYISSALLDKSNPNHDPMKALLNSFGGQTEQKQEQQGTPLDIPNNPGKILQIMQNNPDPNMRANAFLNLKLMLDSLPKGDPRYKKVEEAVKRGQAILDNAKTNKSEEWAQGLPFANMY